MTKLLKTGFKLTTISSFFFWTVAIAEPQGGVVAAGSANISQENSQTVINQTSQSAVINWSSFNTTSSESVLFNQPNASAIALNKINSGLPTNFNGSLNANGKVWIINPAGVLFGSPANINVAGLLATTHNISNSDFMSGNYNFSSPSNLSASIINNGNITAANSGMVALVAPTVINNGIIQANLGKVYLSSGSSFVLDLYGDSLINFGSNPNISTSYVSNSGLIKADGGKVYMTAHAASGILDNVVSMSGVIEANAVSVNKQGEIVLHGGENGTTVVSGKIKASQGHVETSGHVLIVEPTAEIVAGNWLIDPADLTISTSANSNVTGSSPYQPTAASSVLNVTTLQNALASGNVTVQTNNDGFAGSGNITVANAVTWSSGNSLTLQAFNNIIINAAVNGGATGSVNLTAGGSISQALAGVITANTLTTSSVTGTALSTATNIVSNFSATNTTSGNILFTNNSASLTVPSITEQGNGTLTITNTGNIVFPNAYVVTGNTTLTSSAGNIIFNNTVNDIVALTHTLTLSGLAFPTFTGTPGGTTRFGSLSIAESSAITVDATLASFIVDQLNAGTITSIISNTAGINITSPITTSSGTAALTFLANGTSALLDINANVNTGGAQTYRASAAGGTVTLEAGVTIQGGGTISLENRNGNASGGSNAMNIAGQIGSTAKRQAVSLILSSAPNGFDSSLNLISGATIIATSVTGNALGFVITFPAGINWDVSGLLNFRADALGSVGQIHVTGDLGTSLLPIGSINFQAGLAVPGAGLGNSMVVFDNGVNIYAGSLGVISVRGGTQIIINTVPNFHIPGTLSLNTWGQAGATGRVLITGTGALGTAAGQIGTIMLRGSQTYPTPSVEIDAGAQLYATTLNIDEAGSYIFLNNGTTNAYHIPGAMTVTGGNIVYVNGIIGAPGDLVGSLSITGPNNIILNAPTTGIMTSGAQTYTGPVRLNSSETMTNSTGTITFSSTVNNCPDATIGCTSGAGPFNLNVSSTSGGITFNNSIGNLAALNNITLSSPSGTTYITTANGGSITGATLNVTASTINFGPTLSVTTSGAQTYTGAVTLQTFATNNNNVTLNTTGGGSVTFNGTVADSNTGTHGLVITAAGGPAAGIYLNGNITPAVRVLSLTAAEKIHLNASFIDSFGFAAPPSVAMEFFSPVVVDGPTTLQTHFGNMVFHSTITGTAALTIANVNGQSGFGGELRFEGAIGSPGNPLPALNAQVVAQTGVINVNSSIDVTGNLRLSVWNGFGAATGTINLNNAMTYNVGGSVSLESNQGTFNFNGPTINAATGISIDGYSILQANTILTNSTSGNINFLRSLNGDGVSPRSLTTTDTGGGSTIFGGIVGGSVPLSFIDVTGPVAINTSAITTSGLQLYRGAGTLGATTTLTSQTAGITFNSTLDGGFGLTTSVINGQSVTFNGAVGVGTALLSLTTSATGTTFINGGQVRTSSGTQNYNDPVFISANTILGGTGTTGAININSSLDSFDSTPRSLTLTTTAMTTLSGNLGNTNVLSALTVTNASTINTADIFTTTSQTYTGAVTLSAANINLHTNAGGTLTFGNTINGASNLTLNPTASGSVSFANTVGATTALTSLNVTGATAVNTTTMRTTGNQTYNGAISQGANTTYTSTSGANLIKFVSSLVGNAAGRTLTVNSGATGNIEFDSTIGTVGTPFASLTLTGNTTYMAGVGSTVFVSGAEVYNNGLVLNNIPTLTLNGTSVTFNGAVTSAVQETDVTIPGNLVVSSTGSIGQGVGAALKSLTVTGTTNGANNVTTDLNQLYNGAYTVSGNSVLTSTNGSITFNTSVAADANGTRDLTLIAALPVSLSGNWNPANKLLSLTIGSISILTQANISTAAINTTLAQTYFGPVLFQSLAAENFTAPTVTFNNTVRSAVTSTAITITGNLAVGPSGSIGIGSPVPVASLLVTGTTLGPNVTTSGNQTYSGSVTLNTNETMTSTGGTITFNSTINGDGVSGRNLTLSAVNGNVNFNGTIGNLVPLAALSVSTFTVNMNTAMVSTTGIQNYNGSAVILDVPATTATTVLTASEVDIGNYIDTIPTPADLTINGNLVMNTPSGNISTAGTFIRNIIINGSTTVNSGITTPYISSTQNLTFNGNITVLGPGFGGVQPAAFSAGTAGILTVNGNIDGPGPLQLLAGGTGTINVNGNVGGTTPLSSFQIIGFGGTPAIANINTAIIHTVNDQAYTNVAMVLDQNTVWTSNSGGINFSSGTTVNALTNGGQSLQLISPNPVILTGNIGGINKLSLLTIGSNLVATPATIATGSIATTQSQLYWGPVQLGANTVLSTSNVGGAITFESTIDNAFNLTINSDQVRFKGNVGNSTPLNTLNVNANIINFDGAISFIHSNGTQTYTGTGSNPVLTVGADPVFTAPNFVFAIPVVIAADTTYTSTISDIDFQSTVDGPANLTLNPAGFAIFEDDVGGNALINNLVINGQSTISGAAFINTNNNQTYGDLVTMNNNLLLISQNGIVSFTLGTIGTDGITGPAYNLAIYTYNPANGPTGAGIAGTVNVSGFTMGGSGGGNISPLVADYSTVGGSSGVGAWNNTVIDPAATGMYCVNGNCISGTRVLNIDANNDSKTYGQTITPNPVTDVAKITVTGLATGDSVTSIDLTSLGYPQTATVLGSPYVITASNASGAGLANHYTAIVYNNTPGQLTVNTAPLTVTADNVIKTYGQTTTFTGTEFTITSGTLFNGDNIASVTLNSPGASPTANVAGSPYSITPSAAVGTGLSNYTITYDPSGTITVNQAALTLTSDSQVKNYGTTLPSTTTAFTPSGLQNGETVGTVDITSLGLAPTANVAGSPYTIDTVSNAAGGTFDPNNYAITYVAAGTITVNPAALNITSDPQTKTYGTTLPSTTTFFTPTGLQNGETIGTVDITSVGLAPSAGVAGSPYSIDTVSNAAGGTFDPNNYAITYTPANTITVTPAPLDILPDSIVKTYGDVIPSTTTGFTPTGLQNGETVGTIDISSAGLSPTASVLGGPYAIVGSNATGGTFDPANYTINYLSGADITVNPAALTITSDPQTKVFGTNLPPTTTAFTPSGLQNGETIGTVDISSAGLVGSAPVGVYSIDTVSNAVGGTFDPNNYNITYVAAGNITVIDSNAPIIPPNVPPTEEFIPPQGPNCGTAGCDNSTTIIFDPLNGIGIPDYIIVYPVISEPNNSDIQGVVTETNGPASVAIDGGGNMRELKVGSVVYKEDTVVAGATGCACIETPSHEKKCTHDTKNNPAWTNSCKVNYLGEHKLKSKKIPVKDLSKKESVVEASLKVLEDHWWHYPLSDHDIFTR